MNDIKIIILDNLGLIITSLFGGGSFMAYVLERKKRNIENKQLASDALKTMQDAYDKFTQDSLQRYNELSSEVSDLKKKLIDVTSQLNDEEGKYLVLKNAYEKLKSSYDTLKRNFDDYKRKNNNNN